jgi:hypothetical protein
MKTWDRSSIEGTCACLVRIYSDGFLRERERERFESARQRENDLIVQERGKQLGFSM